MIPHIPVLTQGITKPTYPNRTYKIIFNSKKDESNRVSGYTNGVDAVIQAVRLILSSERYKHIIYSWDYGIELLDLYGKPLSYVVAELPLRIKEALTQDNRIKDVTNFEFTKNGKQLHTKFTVISDVGNIQTELEVTV